MMLLRRAVLAALCAGLWLAGGPAEADEKKLPSFAECTFHIPVHTHPQAGFADIYDFFRTLNEIVKEREIPRLNYAFNYADFRGLSVLLVLRCGEKEAFRAVLMKEMAQRHGEKPVSVRVEKDGVHEDFVPNYPPPRAPWPELWRDVPPGLPGSLENPVDMATIPPECRADVHLAFGDTGISQRNAVWSDVFDFVMDRLHTDLFWPFIHMTGLFSGDTGDGSVKFGFFNNCPFRNEIVTGLMELAKTLKPEDGRTYWALWHADGLEGYSIRAPGGE